MNYPLWEIPGIGGPWLIGLISIFYIFISHFAVGGGIFFAITEQIAFNRQDNDLYEFLKKHAQFFLLLITVAGAVSGVGIWFVISLVSPNGTASLIQTFTLGWACEYIFFVAELATIFVYYYTWDKMDQKSHLNIARAYAICSVMTLVIINGILTYMLTPGHWVKSHYWLEGFFNQMYWPSLIIRLVVMCSLAGLYALLTTSLIQKNEPFRTWMLRYSSKWFVPMFVLGPLLAFWFFTQLPDTIVHTIFSGIQSSGVGNFSILSRVLYLSLFVSGTVLIFVFVGPYLNPKGFTFKMALMFALCGLLVTGLGEWSRELLRKPYVIYGYMYSNGLRTNEIAEINMDGYAAHAKWLPANASKAILGQSMFRDQCMSCHTVNGYRSIVKLIGDRDQKSIALFLSTLHEVDAKKNPYYGIMPPVVGKVEELDALAAYLDSLKQKKI